MKNDICLELKNIRFAYPDGNGKQVLGGIDLSLRKGEIVALLGKNGCGKTTLIHLISGFLKPTQGEIIRHMISNKAISSSLIFQENSLLDWKSAHANIELSLISTVRDKNKRKIRVNHILRLMGIAKHKDKIPGQLSGGLKQRVVIGRALAPDPDVLLFDEPFSALDITVKEQLIRDIRKIIIGQNKSAVFITHNIDEALFFADRIIILDSKTKKIGKEIKSIFAGKPNTGMDFIKRDIYKRKIADELS